MDKRVFLLEDDKNIGELVTCALEMSNIETECYPTIAEFWDAVEKDPPAAALLDIHSQRTVRIAGGGGYRTE